MSDIQHTPECILNEHCECGYEQRLRDEIERLKAAIIEHHRKVVAKDFACDEDYELYAVLDTQEPTDA